MSYEASARRHNVLIHEKVTDWNISKGKICAYLAIFIELILLGRNIYLFGFTFHYYVQLYLSMILASIILLVGINIISSFQNRERKYKYAHSLLFIYYLFTLLWGISITMLDQSSSEPGIAYLINLLIVCTLFICNIRTFIILHSIPSTILFIYLLVFNTDGLQLSGEWINIFIFWIFASFAARTLYSYVKKSYEQEFMLKKQNQDLNNLVVQLEQLANYDALTKLPNRNYLYKRLNEQLNGSRKVTVMIIDIDCFKLYNDYYGHIKGDAVLLKVADTISKIAEEAGMLAARVGGEEFIVVGFDMPDEKITRTAILLKEEIVSQQITHEKSLVASHVTISLGYETSEINSIDQFEALIAKADKLLYEAKANGKNQVMCSKTNR